MYTVGGDWLKSIRSGLQYTSARQKSAADSSATKAQTSGNYNATTMGAEGDFEASNLKAEADFKASNENANTLLENARARLASGTRTARQHREMGETMQSDTVAAMVGQGGGYDPVMLAKVQAETNYNSMASLLSAESDSEDLLKQSTDMRFDATRNLSADLFAAKAKKSSSVYQAESERSANEYAASTRKSANTFAATTNLISGNLGKISSFSKYMKNRSYDATNPHTR